MSSAIAITDDDVINKIYLLRGKKVMLDRDLADMYGVETRVLIRQLNVMLSVSLLISYFK